MQKIYLISNNSGKINEFKSYIPSIMPYNIDLKEIQSLDPREVIEHKLSYAFNKIKNEDNLDFKGILVEDTSLFINSLNGLPGTFIKFFLKSIGNEGLCKITNTFSNDLSAYALTIIGFKDNMGQTNFFEGKIFGKISDVPKGENGFGWDKIFIPEGSNKTFSQMQFEEKSKFSMRKIAIKKLIEYLS